MNVDAICSLHRFRWSNRLEPHDPTIGDDQHFVPGARGMDKFLKPILRVLYRNANCHGSGVKPQRGLVK